MPQSEEKKKYISGSEEIPKSWDLSFIIYKGNRKNNYVVQLRFAKTFTNHKI